MATPNPAELAQALSYVRIPIGPSNFIGFGTGTPEGAVVANIGSLFLRTDGSTATTLYVKTATNGANTGWTAK